MTDSTFNSPESIANLITDIADFPKPGIIFKDITPVLEHPGAYSGLIHQLAQHISPEVTKIAAIESRGFLLGAPLAAQLGKGLVLVRKKGKLPGKIVSYTYDLEYGSDTLEVHESSLTKTDKVVIVDDVLATGGTAHATENLCRKLGATVDSFVFLMRIASLNGQKLLRARYHSLLNV